MNNFQSEQ
jgi:hypothetical protein